MSPLNFRKIIYPLLLRRTWPKVRDHLQRLEENQWRSREEIQELQWKKLKALLEFAYEKVPYYKKLFARLKISPADIKAPADFAEVPILTKKDIRENLSDMLAAGLDTGQDVYKSATGGSTGEPVIFYHDNDYWCLTTACVQLVYRWAGLDIGERHCQIWGSAFDVSSRKRIKEKLFDYAGNLLTVPGFELNDANMNFHVEKIARFRPKVITGYTSLLYLVSRYLLRNPRRRIPGVVSVVSSAETLYPYQREVIEKAFGCKVFDRYGGRELGCMAQECERHNGMHVMSDSVYMEFLTKGGAAPPETPGSIVVTSLANFSMPFIRYEIGDLGCAIDEACPCGRGFPLMQIVQGRVHDIIVTPEKKYIPGEFFPHLFKDYEGVRNFQVVQESLDRLTIKIVKDERLREESINDFTDKISAYLGDKMRIEYEFVEQIERGPSGKLRFTISKVPLDL